MLDPDTADREAADAEQTAAGGVGDTGPEPAPGGTADTDPRPDANDLEADWDSIRRAENRSLVNALSMMAPYGAAEKQALLEAPDLKTRAETLIAITEMALARDGDLGGGSLQ